MKSYSPKGFNTLITDDNSKLDGKSPFAVAWNGKGADFYYDSVDIYLRSNDASKQQQLLKTLKDKGYFNDKEYTFFKDRINNVECKQK